MILLIQQRLQDDINKIADWTSDGKIVLNVSKTKTSPRNWKTTGKEAPDTNLKLTCNGSEIELITSQKLLGVILDNHLRFT